MVELLSGVLSGAGIGPESPPCIKRLTGLRMWVIFFMLLDISAFMNVETFVSRVDSTIDAIKACRRGPG